MANTRSASGDTRASSGLRKSRGPSGSTARPGMNFSVAGLGVSSVWMNIVKIPVLAPEAAAGTSKRREPRLEWF
jgi:hypothetical protein